MVDKIYQKYVNRYLKRVSEMYNIEYNVIQYYWKSLDNGCQHVYVQGDKKGCKCGGKVKKLGDVYCRVHKRKKIEIVLHKNKILNRWWHSKTGLVFDGDKKVIGYYNKGLLCELDDIRKELCKKYKFIIK